MRKILALCLALGLVASSGGVASAVNLLVNGELDVVSGQNITGWSLDESKTFSGPTTDLLTLEPWIEIAPITNGGGDPDQGGFVKAFQGNFNTGDLATVHLYQDVAAAPGQLYTLTGMIGAGANYSGLLAGPTQTLLAIDFDNDNIFGNGNLGSAVLDVKAAGLASGAFPTFGAQSFSVTSAAAPLGTTVVRARFAMVDGYNTQNPDPSAFIDDFSLELVPEPSSMALGLLGLLGLAGLIRRR
jgi:MYXO-CTERM domain-containing protein